MILHLHYLSPASADPFVSSSTVASCYHSTCVFTRNTHRHRYAFEHVSPLCPATTKLLISKSKSLNPYLKVFPYVHVHMALASMHIVMSFFNNQQHRELLGLLSNSKKKKKILLPSSLLVNCSVLFFSN